jgi:hypothetical protein
MKPAILIKTDIGFTLNEARVPGSTTARAR